MMVIGAGSTGGILAISVAKFRKLFKECGLVSKNIKKNKET
jgi:hypothetical protein